MAEFVKKPAIGGYKPVAGGSSDSECTHVILTLGEYAGLKRELSSAQQAANSKPAAHTGKGKILFQPPQCRKRRKHPFIIRFS